jgi:hypothetical protein
MQNYMEMNTVTLNQSSPSWAKAGCDPGLPWQASASGSTAGVSGAYWCFVFGEGKEK